MGIIVLKHPYGLLASLFTLPPTLRNILNVALISCCFDGSELSALEDQSLSSFLCFNVTERMEESFDLLGNVAFDYGL